VPSAAREVSLLAVTFGEVPTVRIHIDRQLPVPVPLQLQGQIEYGVTSGDFPPGSRLPSVRTLASELGVSPVTVSTVYAALQTQGLIESTPGRGTFVRAILPTEAAPAGDPVDVALRRALRRAERAGVGPGELIERLQRLVAHTSGARSLRVVLVGVYAEATRAYVADLRRHLGPRDAVVATTFEALERDPEVLAGADLLLTFAHRVGELERRVPTGVPIGSVALIASERTRVALAELDPLARVLLVSSVPEFLVTFVRAVERFASHVADVRTCVLGRDPLEPLVAAVDTVVYATGSEAVLDGLPADVRSFEFRHVPDPVQVETVLVPYVDRLRATRGRDAPALEGP
jgi:GntR family transcriptional regulator